MRKMTCDVAVIGGGAAGMFAAAIASEYGVKTALFEKNQYLGRKLGITGKGRCNITNNVPVRDVIANIPNNGKFLYSAMNAFSPEDTMNFFERIGVKLKTERGNRVFPQSDKAAQVVTALRNYLINNHVEIINEKAEKIITDGQAAVGVRTENTEVKCKCVILATGGLSYPKTGSTGDGYEMAKKLGHSVTGLRPSLVPLEEAGDKCAKMQGLSLRNVSFSVYNSKNKEVFSGFGEMLFTHFGVSGPLVLSASAHMRDMDREKYYGLIDLKPALDDKKLDLRILRDFEKYSNRDIENALTDLIHKTMIPAVIEASGIPNDTKANSITREQRARLLHNIKNFRVDIKGPRPIDEAIVTSGGVNIKEINPSTMESRLVPGLYFAGEIIDADAYTGGFNLQIAWATGYAAGCSAAMRVLEQ